MGWSCQAGIHVLTLFCWTTVRCLFFFWFVVRSVCRIVPSLILPCIRSKQPNHAAHLLPRIENPKLARSESRWCSFLGSLALSLSLSLFIFSSPPPYEIAYKILLASWLFCLHSLCFE